MFILMIRQSLRQNTDAKNSYRLWLLLPLCLVITLTPIAASIINEVIRFGGYGFNDSFTHNSIQAYIVKPTLTINQHLSHNVSIELTLFSIWLLGFSMLAGYWLTLHVDYQKKLMLKPASHHAFTQEIKKLNRSTNSLTLAQSSHVHSPMLMGLFKQILVIPEDFNELYTPEQQQLIIAHEVCHFSHHHMWANQVALLLLALFWFHPLAWRAYAAFRQDQEHACDQFVLSRKQTQSRIEYCKALVVAAETSPPNAFTLMSFKHNGEQSFMFNRIEQIKKMDHKKPISKVAMLALVTLLSTSLVAGVTYASSQLKEAQKQDHKQFEVQPTHRIEPKYPIEAAKAGTEGSVVLKFDVLENGSVTNVEVVNAKPAYVFDKTAVTALKQWRYKASNKVTKNLLVQLDYLMDESSTQPEPLIERIKVSN
ncbi:M56 family metallopeptidase [Colwellia sp. D2M02]|nr:M56 family metallopeptidase [Colwellia sp. D2M02]